MALVATSSNFGTLGASLSVKQYVEKELADTPQLIVIAGCESRYRQYNPDGSVFRGQINPNDIGVLQINLTYNGAEAQKLGYDIYTLQGNVAFAKYLYQQEGSQPWSSSEACWGNDGDATVAQN